MKMKFLSEMRAQLEKDPDWKVLTWIKIHTRKSR